MKTPTLLKPQVIVREFKYLTSAELAALNRKLRQKKTGCKDYAIEAEEIIIRGGDNVRVQRESGTYRLQPGSYFSGRIEYLI